MALRDLRRSQRRPALSRVVSPLLYVGRPALPVLPLISRSSRARSFQRRFSQWEGNGTRARNTEVGPGSNESWGAQPATTLIRVDLKRLLRVVVASSEFAQRF